MSMKPKDAEQPIVQPGQYQHFKGGLYRVLFVAKHSETGEAFVVYRADKSGELWIRPVSMFAEQVAVEGRTRPRFEKLREIGVKRSRPAPLPRAAELHS